MDILKASILIGMMVIFRGQSQNDTFQVCRLNPGLGPNGDDVTRGLSSLQARQNVFKIGWDNELNFSENKCSNNQLLDIRAR